MSEINRMLGATSPAGALSHGSQHKVAATSSGTSFATTLANVGNGTNYSDEDVIKFFSTRPSSQQIAATAANLGLNEEQIARAMVVGKFVDEDTTSLKDHIQSFVSDLQSGYTWDKDGALAVKSTIQGTATPTDKVMPSAESIKTFYATKPTDAQITAKVKALGLNAAQMVQFQATGIGMNVRQISAHVLETMFVDASNRLGTDIGGGKHGGWTSYFSPTLGRAITKSEIQTFFSGNPSQSQIFQKAAELGLGVAAVNNMMVGAGITKPESASKAHGSMDFALYRGDDGYSLDQYGHIVAGGGHVSVDNPDGIGSTWVLRSAIAST
ncbi:MAG: hypothetical protein V4627_08895 [Pseudomonadota bacterium]